MTITFVELVLDDGNLVHIECPSEHEEALHDTLGYSMKRKDFWAPRQFDGCKAEYLGLSLDRINMMKVVGIL